MNVAAVVPYASVVLFLLSVIFAELGEAATSSSNATENHPDLHCVKCNSAYQNDCLNGTKEQLQSMTSECQYKNLSPQARLAYGTDHEGKAWRCLKVVQNVPNSQQIVFRECAFLLPEQARKQESYCRYRSSPSGTNAQICYCNDNLCNSATGLFAAAASMPLMTFVVAILSLPVWMNAFYYY